MMRKKSFNTQESIEKAGKEIRNQLFRKTRKNATVYPKRITGELYRSIRANLNTTSEGLKIDLTSGNNTAFYARFVEKKTKFMFRASASINKSLPEKLRLYVKLYIKDPKFYGNNFSLRE